MKDNDISAQFESASSNPLEFDACLCNGCNICLEVCQVDILIPNREKGHPPVILYPGECWYCGSCVDACPKSGALNLNTPKMNLISWKTK